MGEIDDLLAQLKTEYEPEEQPLPTPKSESSPQPPTSSQSSGVDRLLTQLQLEYQEDSTQLSPTPSKKNNPATPPVSLKTHDLIEDLQVEFEEIEQQEQQKKQVEEQERKQLESLRQQRKQQALTQKAQAWLKKLNPKSEEGKWFEEFSYSYDSKLQAAMDYLEALRETGINF